MGEKLLWQGGTVLGPLPVVLVTSIDPQGRPNLMTAAWCGIVCTKPPMLSVSIRPERLTAENIQANGEFCLNLVNTELVRAADWCGVKSGRDVDKFAQCQLSPIEASCIKAPLIDESPLSLECRVTQEIALGSHTLYLARIEAVQVDAGLVDSEGKLDMGRADLVAWCHGQYHALSIVLGFFGYSVRRRKILKRERRV
jgi:flavin reductase (DIM6/NTAB) family NADH-FMN oxidoreductase RutF